MDAGKKEDVAAGVRDLKVEAHPGGVVFAVASPSPEPARPYSATDLAPAPPPGPPYAVEKHTDICQLYVFAATPTRAGQGEPALAAGPRPPVGAPPITGDPAPIQLGRSPTPGQPAPTQIDGPRFPPPTETRPDPGPKSHRRDPGQQLLRRPEPGAAAVTSPPPEVPPPLSRLTWTAEPSEGAPFRAGSFFHAGPPTAAADKGGNQDFAFHLHLLDRAQAPWVVFGVADGVSQATWSARAARHAAAAFIETVHGFFDDKDFPHTEALLLGDRWWDPLTHRFHRGLMQRLEQDVELLREGRYVDATWTPDLFAQQFWEGSAAAQRVRTEWMQTTLLAVALGPHGGFAFFLGDGFTRIDREIGPDEWETRSGLEPTRQISMELTEAHVRGSVHRLAGKGARRLGVLVTTDGVSKSSPKGLEEATRDLTMLPGPAARPALDRVVFTSSRDCEVALDRLAVMPPSLADVDNMSIAFGLRTLEPSRQR
jgi:hypothetical protein